MEKVLNVACRHFYSTGENFASPITLVLLSTNISYEMSSIESHIRLESIQTLSKSIQISYSINFTNNLHVYLDSDASFTILTYFLQE